MIVVLRKNPSNLKGVILRMCGTVSWCNLNRFMYFGFLFYNKISILFDVFIFLLTHPAGRTCIRIKRFYLVLYFEDLIFIKMLCLSIYFDIFHQLEIKKLHEAHQLYNSCFYLEYFLLLKVDSIQQRLYNQTLDPVNGPKGNHFSIFFI